MRLVITDLYSQRSETLDGSPEQVEGMLAHMFPDQCHHVDPDEGLDELVDHLNHEFQGKVFEVLPPELTKAQEPPRAAPKLGIHRISTQVDLVNSPRSLFVKRMVGALKPVAPAGQRQKQVKDVLGDPSRGSFINSQYDKGPTPPHQRRAVGYARSGNVGADPIPAGVEQGTKHHEQWHALMGAVGAKYGDVGRRNLARNLWAALPQQYQGPLAAMHESMVGKRPDDPNLYEERIARIYNYLNSSKDREVYHRSEGHFPREVLKFGRVAKRANQALRAIMEIADEDWVKAQAPWTRPMTKAIADIQVGKPAPKAKDPMFGGARHFSYSHLLAPKMRDDGYRLMVAEHPDPHDGTHALMVKLMHPSGSNRAHYGPGQVGAVTGTVSGSTLKIHAAEVDEEHRGGKGAPMYEALLAHASKRHGATMAIGDTHSTMAHRVHKKLAAKHGLSYRGVPTPLMSRREWEETKSGPDDQLWAPYQYMIKAEDRAPSQKPKSTSAMPVPKKKSQHLLVQHNLTAGNLQHAHEIGGLAAPSLAVAHKKHPLTNFGEITLVGHHDLIDPAHGTPVFDADIYSPRHPRPEHEIQLKPWRDFEKWYEPFRKRTGQNGYASIDEDFKKGGAAEVTNRREHRWGLGLAWLENVKGEKAPEVMRPKRRQYEWTEAPAMRQFVADNPNLAWSTVEHDSPKYKEFSDAATKAIEEHFGKIRGEDSEMADSLISASKEKNFDENGKLFFGHAWKVHEDARKVGEMEPDSHSLQDHIDSRIEQLGRPEFEQWAAQKLAPLQGAMYIPKYSSNTGKRWKIAYTLDNILKEMTRKIRGGENFHYGLGTARSFGAKRFRSIDKIRDSHQQIVAPEKFKKLKEKMDKRFGDLATRLGGGFKGLDGLAQAIGESYRPGHYLQHELKLSGFDNVSDDLHRDIQEFARELVQMPTEYFEAKPQRVVQLNEFKGAVIPKNTQESVRNLLREHNIPVEEYDPDNETDRGEAIHRFAEKNNLLLSEDEVYGSPLLKSEFNLSVDSNTDLIRDMHGFQPHLNSAFKAARFLSGKTNVLSFERLRQALYEHDGDINAAALSAYGLADTDENRKALHEVRQFEQMSKSEHDVGDLGPVVPGLPEGKETAEQVSEAFANGHVESIKLGGVHSAGSLLAKAPDHTWLLKPGAEGVGPAAGAQQERATQSRRESAFWHIAEAWGLGDDIPRCDLLLIGGKEYAAIKMLAFDWKNLGDIVSKDRNRGLGALQKYRESGILHQWAILDYVLGNPDRHSSNEMISPEDEIKLIDHGSAFAGPGFDPAHDKNSFVPFYLRAWIAQGRFKKLNASERLTFMPTVNHEVEGTLRRWVQGLDGAWMSHICERYGINPDASLQRLRRVKMLPDVAHGINELWVTT